MNRRPDDDPDTVALPPVADDPPTEQIPAVDDAPTETVSDEPIDAGPPPNRPPERARQSLGRASSMIAVASLSSRITGFVRQIALVAVLGLGFVNSSYTIANTLPNIVYELLLGGVLSSVMIPLLVRAQTEDADGGEAYTRKLLTVLGLVLLVATAVAMLAAPLLTQLYLGGHGGTGDADVPITVSPDLATAFAVLLLPQIFFYGIGALLGAILNSRGVFAPFAWAPVLNNVVVLAVLGVYVMVPGEISLDPVRMGDTKLLVLGLGTTLGIVAQALVLIPAVRRLGGSYRPLWGWDRRLTAASGLAVWVITYVLIGQIGYVVTTRVAWTSDVAAPAIYANVWLLLQVPYGVLGVSLLTALMPRMSRSAAEGRTPDVIADLSLGSRLATVLLLPISVLLTLYGPAVGVALFSLGQGSDGGGNARLGMALAWSAFGLVPFAVTMLQLRVFYALTDSRTPTMIQLVVVAVKIPMLLACPLFLAPADVVLGLAAANSASFVIGAVLGNVLLRRRLGSTRSGQVVNSVGRALLASLAGGIASYAAVGLLAQGPVGTWAAGPRAWAVLVVATAVFVPVTLLAMRLVRQPELAPVWRRVRGRRKSSQEEGVAR
ncbi:murein biosynthesis integral membrane protein MurJ [Pseudonocardia sp.]|uniref:murein biosynthesis integral membrane protein MurJ n=1 Tax=Pseudonocardia sp. TaxID=60912 RepID=UPI003D0EB95B